MKWILNKSAMLGAFGIKLGVFFTGFLFFTSGEVINYGFLFLTLSLGLWLISSLLKQIFETPKTESVNSRSLETQAQELANSWVLEFEKKYGQISD